MSVNIFYLTHILQDCSSVQWCNTEISWTNHVNPYGKFIIKHEFLGLNGRMEELIIWSQIQTDIFEVRCYLDKDSIKGQLFT